jgi:hypothetical protein
LHIKPPQLAPNASLTAWRAGTVILAIGEFAGSFRRY